MSRIHGVLYKLSEIFVVILLSIKSTRINYNITITFLFLNFCLTFAKPENLFAAAAHYRIWLAMLFYFFF